LILCPARKHYLSNYIEEKTHGIKMDNFTISDSIMPSNIFRYAERSKLNFTMHKMIIMKMCAEETRRKEST